MGSTLAWVNVLLLSESSSPPCPLALSQVSATIYHGTIMPFLSSSIPKFLKICGIDIYSKILNILLMTYCIPAIDNDGKTLVPPHQSSQSCRREKYIHNYFSYSIRELQLKLVRRDMRLFPGYRRKTGESFTEEMIFK